MRTPKTKRALLSTVTCSAPIVTSINEGIIRHGCISIYDNRDSIALSDAITKSLNEYLAEFKNDEDIRIIQENVTTKPSQPPHIMIFAEGLAVTDSVIQSLIDLIQQYTTIVNPQYSFGDNRSPTPDIEKPSKDFIVDKANNFLIQNENKRIANQFSISIADEKTINMTIANRYASPALKPPEPETIKGVAKFDGVKDSCYQVSLQPILPNNKLGKSMDFLSSKIEHLDTAVQARNENRLLEYIAVKTINKTGKTTRIQLTDLQLGSPINEYRNPTPPENS